MGERGSYVQNKRGLRVQFTVLINQARAVQWGLNHQQAMLFAFVYGCAAWADSVERYGKVWFWVDRSKVCDELPLLTDKPDTVYRLLKQLEKCGLIELCTVGNRPFVHITPKGALWNQHAETPPKHPDPQAQSTDPLEHEPCFEPDPTEVFVPEDGSTDTFVPEPEPVAPVDNLGAREKNLGQGRKNFRARVGKISEVGSEKYPTYQVTSNQITKIKKNINSQPPPGDLAQFAVDRFEPGGPWLSEFIGSELDAPLEQLVAEFEVYHRERGTVANRSRWVGMLVGWLRRRVLPPVRSYQGVNHA